MGETNNSERHPKVFISYSWTSDAYSDKVRELAERMLGDGVDVVLDQWELEPGQDMFAFMERCVNDPEIDKVLILCDKKYAEKANKREGGVGNETAIITKQVYENVKQTKFIPVVMERDAEGKPYLPTYLHGRFSMDFCKGDEKSYRKLVRRIYGRSEHPKPHRGKTPAWLDEIPETGKKKGPQTSEQFKDTRLSDVKPGVGQKPSWVDDETSETNNIHQSDRILEEPVQIMLPDIGDPYTFGAYPQNQAGKKERIEWRVLDRKEKERQILLISRYALDCKKYNERYTSVTWEQCTLRKWLNNDFYNTAFSGEEKKQIALTTVTADRNPKYNTDPGRDTKDKIFLLSIKEAKDKKYFSSDNDRICYPTPYACDRGAWKSGSGTCVWWLRSPGLSSDVAADVCSDGSVYDYGIYVGRGDGAVRPALWVNL